MANKGKKKCPKCGKLRNLVLDLNNGERMCPLCFWLVPCKEPPPKDGIVAIEIKVPKKP